MTGTPASSLKVFCQATMRQGLGYIQQPLTAGAAMKVFRSSMEQTTAHPLQLMSHDLHPFCCTSPYTPYAELRTM
mgnify:CR=1 FL=1